MALFRKKVGLGVRQYRKRIEEILAMKAARGKGEPWRYLDAQSTERSVELAFEVPRGMSAKDIEGQVDAIAAACGSPVEIENRLGAVVVRILPVEMETVVPFNPKMLAATSGTTLLLGYDRMGRPVTHDFRVPHGLFAGQSRYGKTQLIQLLLLQLVDRFTPEDLEIQIIDMKQTSFRKWRDVPHVTRIARDLPSAVDVLESAHETMQRRGAEIWERPDRKYPLLLVLIDEAAQIAPSQQSTKPEKELANRAWRAAGAIACVGAELRVGLWYCTQRPDANSINPQVKANMDMAVCFRVKTRSNSEIVLDHPGAEKLPQDVPGRGIYSTTGDVTFQAPYVGGESDWERVLAPYRRARATEAVQAVTNEGEAVQRDHEDEREETDLIIGALDTTGDFYRPGGETLLRWNAFPDEAGQ